MSILSNTTSSKEDEDGSGGDSSRILDDDDEDDNATVEDSKVQAARDERKSLGSQETRAVHCLRFFALLVLSTTTVLVTGGVYLVLTQAQDESFANENESSAAKIIESFHTSVQQCLDSHDAMSTTMTSYAIDTGATFPNVTIPDFELRGSSTRIMAQAVFVQYMPYVTDDNRKEWEAYATANQGHLIPSFLREQGQQQVQDAKYGYTEEEEEEKQDSNEGSTRRSLQLESVTDQTFREEIWGTTGNGETEAANTGPYLPTWQISPALPIVNFLNFNARDFDFFRGAFDDVLANGMASFGAMTHLNEATDENKETHNLMNAFLSLGQYRHTLVEYAEDPVTVFGFPVFDRLTPQGRKVIGILGSALYWRLMFTDILPQSSDGRNMFDVVVKNTFGQVETYRIDGPSVSYMGIGDLHEVRFDEMESSADVADFVASLASPETQSYTAVDLNSEYISYSIHVYPTSSMESNYLTNQPLYYAIIVASIFVFTTCVFLLYNLLVERRQKVVMDKAAKSTAVVKSLFPENVQERLYEETEEAKSNDKAKWLSANTQAQSRLLSEYLSSGEFHAGDVPLSSTGAKRTNSKTPIADLFPDATVFFADLAGFTRWSSKRKPTDVFGLLETIYAAFDRIAKRRGVFKVETIGDCYVAVTGVPQAQVDHAIIMAKFSSNCMLKLKQLLLELTDEYGHDTSDLSLRIGLHSGPVTAGVLRGERSRFQLFGDTVNTAARMESNGVPGRIHCSEATAQELKDAGKSSWLRPREGKINAKGKGELQTYWIEAVKCKTVDTASSFESPTPISSFRKGTSTRRPPVELPLSEVVSKRAMKSAIPNKSDHHHLP